MTSPVNMGTVKPGSRWPPDEEQIRMQTVPHKFLSEASKMGAQSCSIRAYVRAQIARKCWWCGLKEDAGVHD